MSKFLAGAVVLAWRDVCRAAQAAQQEAGRDRLRAGRGSLEGSEAEIVQIHDPGPVFLTQACSNMPPRFRVGNGDVRSLHAAVSRLLSGCTRSYDTD